MIRCPSWRVLPVLVFWLCVSGSLLACPFCTLSGQTLSGDLKSASLVLFGRLGTPDIDKGETEFEIDTIVKSHPILKKGQKKVSLRRYLPLPDPRSKKTMFLVFCDVYKGRLDPSRGVALVPGSDMPKYLEGAQRIQSASVPERLKFFFEYLENEDLEISTDAHKEFGNSSYEEFRKMASTLPADRVLGWLQDEDTPSYRLGLYGSMLGHCGQTAHASALRSLLDGKGRRLSSGVGGVLAAYTLLVPEVGWAYIRNILGDPEQRFLRRFQAQRAAKFFWENRPEVIDKDELASAVALGLDQKDMADLAIETLRKWERWDLDEKVFSVVDKPPFKISVVRRAVLRYALAGEMNSKLAAEYVKKKREEDPVAVEDAKEILALERPRKKPSN